MKKTLVTAFILALLVGLFMVGSVSAQGNQPPMQDRGILHPYLAASLAEELGLETEDVEARMANGESMYEIALAAGIAKEDIPVLLLKVRTEAIGEAVADGVLSQELADWMLTRMERRGQGGSRMGTCQMDGTNPGSRHGGPGMMGSGLFQQTTP